MAEEFPGDSQPKSTKKVSIFEQPSSKKVSIVDVFTSGNMSFDETVPGGIGMNGDLSQMNDIEAEKEELQKRLVDARGALDEYTTKLSSQVCAINIFNIRN